MPIAVSRALAFSAGVSLLVLLALGGQAQAAKSTKTVNARSTLTSLVNQTKSLPRLAASRTAKARLLSRARRARSVASKTPCSAVNQLSLYRKTLKATKIRSSVKGKAARARLAKRLAALGPASNRASRKLLSDRRTRSCGGGVVTPTRKTVKTTVRLQRRERHEDRRRPARRAVRREDRGRQVVDAARAAEHRLDGRARHAGHPGLVEHDRHPGRREALGASRHRRSPTRSTTSSCSRSSPSRSTRDPAVRSRRSRTSAPASSPTSRSSSTARPTAPTRSFPPRRPSARRSARRAT